MSTSHQSIFKALAAAGAKTHFFGNVIQAHAALQAFCQLAAVDVFTDADNHGVIVNENDS